MEQFCLPRSRFLWYTKENRKKHAKEGQAVKNRKSKGIYSQLFSQFLLTSLVPILTLGLVIVLFARQFSMSSLKYELSSSTGTAAEGFTRELDACQAGLEMLAQSQEVQDLLATGGWDDRDRKSVV